MKKELKYIRLFEAFESEKLSKTFGFLNKDGKSKFLTSLKNIANTIDFPISEFSDEYFQYLPFERALDLNFSYEDKVCGATSKEAFPDFGVNGEVCNSGMIKRKWGNSIRQTKCPICDGTGIEKRDKNSYSIKWIKFWFDKDGNFLKATGTDGQIRYQHQKNSKYLGITSLSSRLEDYDVVKSLTHQELVNLPIGSVVKIVIQGQITLGVIWKSEQHNSIYIIQNSHDGGSDSDNITWKKWGRYSWNVDSETAYRGGSAELLKLNKTGAVDEIELVDPYAWNAPLNISEYSGLSLGSDSNMEKSLSNAHFAIVLNFLDLKESEFMKKSDINSKRAKEKRGALALANDDEIRKTNIARYIEEIKKKLDISPELSDMNKTFNRYMGGPYMGIYVLIGRNFDNLKYFVSRIDKFLSATDEDDKRTYYNASLSDFKNIIERNLKLNSALSMSIKTLKNECQEYDRREKLMSIIDGVLDLNTSINSKFKNMEFETLEDMEIAYQKITAIKRVFTESDRLGILELYYLLDQLVQAQVTRSMSYLSGISNPDSTLVKIQKLKKFIERL